MLNFAWLLGWAPSWLVMGSAGLLMVAGLAALVWSRLPLAAYRTPALVGGAAAVALSAWLGGVASEKSLGEAAALRAELAAAEKAIAFQTVQINSLAQDSVTASRQAAKIKELEDKLRAAQDQLPGRACLDGNAAGRVRDFWK